MKNKWTRDDVHGITTLICDSEYDPKEEMPPFLVEGIVHRSMTLVFGAPYGGKSTLIRTVAAALANGDKELFGKRVMVPGGLRVAVIAADPDSAREYAEEFRLLLCPGVSVPIHCPDLPVGPKTWDEMHSLTDRGKYQLVVVDNLTQFTPGGDLMDTAAIQAIYHELRWFDTHQIAVIVLAHASVKEASSTALGITTIHAGPRWQCQIKGAGSVRRLSFKGNPREGGSWSLAVTLDGGRVVVADAADELADRRERRRGSDVIGKLEARHDWKSQTQAADALGIDKSTVNRALTRAGKTIRDGRVVSR